MRNFLTTEELSREELEALIDSGLRFKHQRGQSNQLAGKSVALVFF